MNRDEDVWWILYRSFDQLHEINILPIIQFYLTVIIIAATSAAAEGRSEYFILVNRYMDIQVWI